VEISGDFIVWVEVRDILSTKGDAGWALYL
jgi:hypothetical protein